MSVEGDFLLEGEGLPPAYVEVKNVHLMREAGLAERAVLAATALEQVVVFGVDDHAVGGDERGQPVDRGDRDPDQSAAPEPVVDP